MRQHAGTPAITSALYTVLSHVPDDRLRQLLLMLLSMITEAPAPMEAPPVAPRAAKRSRRGWPRGKPRGPRKASVSTQPPIAPAIPSAADRAKALALAAIDEKLAARRKRSADARRAARGNGTAAAPAPTGQ